MWSISYKVNEEPLDLFTEIIQLNFVNSIRDCAMRNLLRNFLHIQSTCNFQREL